jgi:flagellar protein FliS
MNAYSQSSAYNAYQSVANHGRVAAANPHGLILMLMDGAVERIARARGCIENKDFAGKAHLLHRAVAIIDELRTSLDTKNGGSLAGKLHELYDYMCRELLQATVDNNVDRLDGVLNLLRQVRDAWVEIPKLQGSGR